MVTSKRKVNIPMTIAMILLCLVLITTHLTAGLYARYTTSSSSTASARVIRFGDLTITETGDFLVDGNYNKFIITPGTEVIKDINIKFTGSEAKTYIFVKLVLDKETWVSNDSLSHKKFVARYDGKELMNWSITDDWEYLSNTNGYVYFKAIEPNSGTVSYDFIADTVVGGNNGKIVFTDNITSSVMEKFFGTPNGIIKSGMIRITAFVVQANGFNSVEDAWASVSGK